MGSRLSQSMTIFKQSVAVLRTNRQLLWFPILSGIASIAVLVAIILPYSLIVHFSFGHNMIANYAVSFVSYLVGYFVVVFFNVALVASSYATLHGQNGDLKYGLGVAMSRLPQIIGWSLLGATVSTILRAIGERFGFIGQIVTGLVGAVWAVAVFFVSPLLAIEGIGPVTAVKTSVNMSLKTWGERLILGVGLGTASFIISIPLVLIMGFGIFMLAQDMLLVGFGIMALSILGFLALAILTTALQGVFQTSLYVYARTGQTPTWYSPDIYQAAFAQKPQSKIFAGYRRNRDGWQ